MNEQEKQAIYSVLVRLIESGEVLTQQERRDLLNQLCMANSRMTLDEILSATKNNRKLQIKRGTALENDTYTGSCGEITMDMDARTIRVHNGEKVGGVALAKSDDIPNSQKIILATIPDYTNGTECVFLSETTAPENGYFEVTGTAFNNTYLTISLNGVTKKIATSTNNTFSTTGFVLFPVKQGDTIQGISSHNNTGKITFYPTCK